MNVMPPDRQRTNRSVPRKKVFDICILTFI